MPSHNVSAETRQSRKNQRRIFLKRSAALLGSVATPAGLSLASSRTWAGVASAESDRSLQLYNAHTGENVDTVYWEDGEYLDDQVLRISHLLRDHRENETMMIDPALMDILWAVKMLVNERMRYNVISGYRTPKTNEMLRKNSPRVAKFSLHMVGKAVDIRGTEGKLEDIQKAGLKLAAGGVGIYPGAGFVHLDSGDIRSWESE